MMLDLLYTLLLLEVNSASKSPERHFIFITSKPVFAHIP